MAAGRELRVGVVGVGSMGARHFETVRALGVPVVGVADDDLERARSVAAATEAAAYSNWEALLESEEIDALLVCTPPAAHAGPAVAALNRGINVFVEKPLARTLADAERIVEAAEGSDAVCAVGYQWRAVSFLDDVREALSGQEISLLIGRSLGPTRARSWFLDRVEGGAIMLELASHDIDLHRAIAGDVVAVSAAASDVPLAQSGVESPTIEDVVTLTLRFANGALGCLGVGWTSDTTPQVYSVDIFATDATLHVALDPTFRLEGVSRGQAVEAAVAEHPSVANVRRFLDVAAGRLPGPVFSTPRDAADALRVALACEEALASGGWASIGELASPS
jgi:predicted dehydrogenase